MGREGVLDVVGFLAGAGNEVHQSVSKTRAVIAHPS